MTDIGNTRGFGRRNVPLGGQKDGGRQIEFQVAQATKSGKTWKDWAFYAVVGFAIFNVIGLAALMLEDPEARAAREAKMIAEAKIEAQAAYERKIASEQAAEERRVAREKAEYEQNCGQKQVPLAFVMMQRPIRAQLKAPSTASFPYAPTVGQPIGKCRFRITSYVDAQNGFGAMIRTPWTGVIEYFPSDRTWRVHEARISG